MSPTDSTVRVAVVGLGAIGGLMAAGLASLGPQRVRLCALARGETLAAVRERGLILEQAGQTQQHALKVSDDAQTLGEQDLVIVSVKGPALAGVASQVQALMGPHTRVLVAMNGLPWWFFQGQKGPCEGLTLSSVDPHAQIAQAIPARQVIGGVVHGSAVNVAPGHIRHVAGQGLVVGDPWGQPSAALQTCAQLLQAAGWNVTVSGHIQHDVWFKLWGNMTVNPISVLTGATADRIMNDDLVRGLCSAVMLEAQALGAKFGCPIDQTPEERHAVTRKLGAFKTSMLQDWEAGRPLEIDALLGSVREVAQHLRQPTPFIDALLGLLRLKASRPT